MDAEKGITEDPSSRLNSTSPSSEANHKPPMRRRRCLMFGLCCFSLLIIIAIVIVILAFTVFKKKDPTITINDITITGVSPDIDLPSLSIDFNITFSVNSTVYNPNMASFKHYPGTVDILYRETDIGYVDLEEGTIPERGSEEVMSNVTLTLDSFGQVNLTSMEVPPLIRGILQRLFVICLGRADNENQSKIALRAASGAVLARLLIMNTNYLAQLVSEPSLNVALHQGGLNTTQNILLCLVDFWLDKIDSVTTMQSKAYALALSIILTLRLPEVIDKLDEILSACTSIILGAEDQNEETSLDSSSSTSSCNDFEYDSVPCKVLRQKQIRAQDPIKRLSLENILRENLQACAALHGDASFNAVINSIHPSALAQLKQALNMP